LRCQLRGKVDGPAILEQNSKGGVLSNVPIKGVGGRRKGGGTTRRVSNLACGSHTRSKKWC